MTNKTSQVIDQVFGNTTADLRAMLDAEIARREKAEADLVKVTKERDEARKRYCHNASMQTYVGGSSGYTPRQVCETVWPTEVDRLFPSEVTP